MAIAIAGFATLGCGVGDPTPVRLSLEIDRASCGVTELEDFPLPQQTTLSLSVSVDMVPEIADECRVATDSGGLTLANLAAVADDIGLATEVFLDTEDLESVLSRVSFGAYAGLFEQCDDLSGAMPFLSGESDLFSIPELTAQESPTIVIPVECPP